MVGVVADSEDVRWQLSNLLVLVLLYVLRRVDWQDLVRIDSDQYRPSIRLIITNTRSDIIIIIIIIIITAIRLTCSGVSSQIRSVRHSL